MTDIKKWKVLIVNKFLYPNGGSETYIFEIGKQLQIMGHEVQYFGMEHEGRIVGNRVGCYTSSMNFHSGALGRFLYPFKIIYSKEARSQIRKVLNDFKPDVVHLNNFNFQITPSIIYEVKEWAQRNREKVLLIYTAHDYQWICPNHMMIIPESKEKCFQCKGGKFFCCTKNRCIHNSKVKSFLGTLEAEFYAGLKTYKLVDKIICPSKFMEEKLATNPLFEGKLVTLYNFLSGEKNIIHEKKDYVLYFGRFSEEKGVRTLLNVCKRLPEISFIFAGGGLLEEELSSYKNIRNVGFLKGEELKQAIARARFSVFPSEWYENCPFSVMESQQYGTPVIASAIGGVPELVKNGVTGELFEAGNEEQLKEKIESLWNDEKKCREYSNNCQNLSFDSTEEYCEKLLKIYQSCKKINSN